MDMFKSGGFKYQLTMNIPTFTKASKIYKYLIDIMKETKAKDKIMKKGDNDLQKKIKVLQAKHRERKE
jgi:hypothetical protein